MLSPGDFHTRVPRERIANLLFRRKMLTDCRDSLAARRAIYEACRQDILFYINVFCFIYEPRNRKTYAWTTWPFQDDYIIAVLKNIEEQRDDNTTKSRDMGASWMLCAIHEWLWHFHKDGSYLFLSRNELFVDSENPDSLFWKIDFLHRYQPNWLLPAGMVRRQNFFGNPKMNSTINGSATTSGAGVGGRYTSMVIDEFSRMLPSVASEILQGTVDSCRSRHFNYTFWGPISHPSYDLADRVDVRQLKLHWTLHPEKSIGQYQYDVETKRPVPKDPAFEFPAGYRFNLDGKVRSLWYDETEAIRNDPQGMALHVDMDRRGYGGQFFPRQTILNHADRHGREPLWEGDLDFDRDLGDPIRLVPVEGGPLKLWVIPGTDGLPPAADYGAGADVSRGSGATPSALAIGNAETGEKVLEYVDAHIEPIEFATKCVSLCKLFKNRDGRGARFAWEIPGPGQSVSKRVGELNYPYVYRRTDEKRSRFAAAADDVIAGWTNNRQTIAVLLEEYRAALLEGHLVNRSRVALAETLEFGYIADGSLKHKSEKSKDPSATGENHGDVVIADALMWKMMKELGAGKPDKPLEAANAESMKTMAYRRKMFEQSRTGGDRLETLLRPGKRW